MFKHVSKRSGLTEGSSDSGSDSEDEQLQFEEGSEGEFTGFGDEANDENDDGLGGDDEELEFEDEEEAEELPENLPSLQDAVDNPIFELSSDAKGRKTLICISCPDKILREGAMRSVHLQSTSHIRRQDRYRKYIKEHPEVAEETSDPRAVAAHIDRQLRLKKSGGAGFTVDPSGKRRKRRRKPKTVGEKDTKKEASEGASAADENSNKPSKNAKSQSAKNEPPTGDGIAEVSGMKATNAKQKRQAAQAERKRKAVDAGEETKDVATAAKDKAGSSNKKAKLGDAQAKGKPQGNGGKPKPAAGQAKKDAKTGKPTAKKVNGKN